MYIKPGKMQIAQIWNFWKLCRHIWSVICVSHEAEKKTVAKGASHSIADPHTFSHICE